MSLSREAKMLIALVAVAAAIWVWVNYFTQPTRLGNTTEVTQSASLEQTPTPPVSASASEADRADDADEVDPAVVASLGEALVAPPGALAGEAVADSAAETTLPVIISTPADESGFAVATDTSAGTGGSSTSVSGNDTTASVADMAVVDLDETGGTVLTGTGAADTGAAGTGGAVVADSSLPSVAQPSNVAARELNVAELPFLVTAPPSGDLPEDATADAELELARPREELRATVNPFSPILLDAPPEQPVANRPPTGPAPDGSLIQTVDIPEEPSGTTLTTPAVNPANPVTPTALAPAVPERVNAPAPRAVTPSSLQNGSLPKALPGGTLPATPKLLRNTRTVAATPDTRTGPDSLAAVAAVRVPGERSAPGFKTAAAPSLSASAETPEVAPLRFGGLPEPALAGGPLAAGTSGLSRYLRDSNYQFTGSVVGPVGVGVFRSNLAATPVLVSLGQTLPDTEIVLTSLQGEQAEFTQDGNKQILILDLR